jgi:hypothetical protein
VRITTGEEKMMHTRRQFILLIASLAFTASIVACSVPPTLNTSTTVPQIKILSPANGATVDGPKVTFDVEVAGWRFVDANQPAKDGEGHLHFFINIPASAVQAGSAIPLDQKATFVHAGKAPYAQRKLELSPGEHTVTVVMGNSLHQALANPAPASVTFTVK